MANAKLPVSSLEAAKRKKGVRAEVGIACTHTPTGEANWADDPSTASTRNQVSSHIRYDRYSSAAA